MYIAGHLTIKKGRYYAVLSYNDSLGKRHEKWVATGLPVKGNKKRAEEFLMNLRRDFVPPEPQTPEEDMTFAEFCSMFLDLVKGTIAIPTYSSYEGMLRRAIIPYFAKRGALLKNLGPKDIQLFYASEMKRVSATTVIHYHALIHKALKYAVKIDLIDVNPADNVERPKREHFEAGFYNSEEMGRLFEVSRGTKLEIPILLGAFYGLRRSEVIGLKWNAIDFEQNTITIKHTVTSCNINGRIKIVESDTTKTKSSLRTLPLVPFVKERLLALKDEQEKNRQLCGRSYNKKYVDYVCVNEVGNLIKTNYVSEFFPKLLEKNGLRRIRFHDLRHSCASLMLANGVPMKQIQEWLGHSDFSTTANIYAHLDSSSKLNSANALMDCLGKGSV